MTRPGINRGLRFEQGSQALQAAGAALAAALVVLALLGSVRDTLAPLLERAFACATATLTGGARCTGSVPAATADAPPGETTAPASGQAEAP